MISESLFLNSYSSKDGGSIYISSRDCIQYRVCSINSTVNKTSGIGCHSYNTAYYRNFIIESSISKSAGSIACIWAWQGNQIIDSTNISYTKCHDDAAYFLWSSDSNQINFTSIFNNTANEHYIMFHLNYYYSYISRCNVINNDITEKGSGIIFSDCKLEISLCVFSSNYGPCLFYNQNLFNKDGYIIVDQCYLNNPNISKPSSGSSVRLSTTSQFVLNLPHLSIEKCVADIPLTKTAFHCRKKTYAPSYTLQIIFTLF